MSIEKWIAYAQELNGAPDEFLLYPDGETKTDDGIILVDALAREMTVAALKARGNDLVIDYEHATLFADKAPAAGWIPELIDKGSEGLWAKVNWTDIAKGFLERREYRYFSPVSLVRQSDRRLTQFHSIALTNTPKTHNLTAIVAKQTLETGINQIIKEEVMKEALLKLLSLKEEATEDEIISTVTALKTTSETEVIACKEVIEALALDGKTGKSEVVAAIHVLKAQGSGVSQADFLVLKDKLAKRDRDDLVSMALKAGKVTPAQKDWADNYALSDPEGFKIFVDKSPVVVSGGEQAGGSGPEKEGMLDTTQMAINKQLGVSDEAFKKHQKKDAA